MLPRAPSRRVRFGGALAVALAALMAAVGCGPEQAVGWICLNPVTGKEDPNTYDPNHAVNGTIDPCHCYDPCGPLKTCPIVVDAGTPPSGCDAGTGTGGSGG
jgi:hypothetical protein